MHLCVVRSRSACHSQIIYPHMMSVQCGNAHHHYALSSSSTTLTFPIHIHTHCYASQDHSYQYYEQNQLLCACMYGARARQCLFVAGQHSTVAYVLPFDPCVLVCQLGTWERGVISKELSTPGGLMRAEASQFGQGQFYVKTSHVSAQIKCKTSKHPQHT